MWTQKVFGRAVLLDITHKMEKNFRKNLDECDKLDLQIDRIRVSVRHSNVPGQLVASAYSNLWLGVSRKTLFDFLVDDEKSRVQWDIFSDESSMKAIADISFGSYPGNRISIFQPPSLSESSKFIIQESFNDPLGSVIIYAPISVEWIRSVISGEVSYVPILPVGFIISGDGYFEMSGDGASSSSSSRMPGGSVLTMYFQMFAKPVSEPGTSFYQYYCHLNCVKN